MRYMTVLAAAVLAAAAVLGGAAAQAGTAINLTDPRDPFDAATLTVGYQFSVDHDLTVSSLGVFDDNKDGLFKAAPVGLWTADGDLLASATIGAGTAGHLDGFFRYADVAPLRLHAGQHYIVAAYYALDEGVFFGKDSTSVGVVNPHIRLEGDRFLNTNTFGFPGLTEGSKAVGLGGNFRYDNVPEPATWAMMITGFGLAGAQMRARRRSMAA